MMGCCICKAKWQKRYAGDGKLGSNAVPQTILRGQAAWMAMKFNSRLQYQISQSQTRGPCWVLRSSLWLRAIRILLTYWAK